MIVSVFRWLTLISYFGLLISLLAWILLAPHSNQFPKFAMLILGIFPLLLPMRGLLYARSYTHAWTSFLMLAYFSHGVGEVYSDSMVSLYPWLEVILSCVCFMGCILFVKYEAKLRSSSQNSS